MSGIRIGGRANRATHHPCPRRSPVARRAARWLGFAAMPAFAIMALLVGISDGYAADLICSSAHGGSPLDGMASMYLLMAVFHSPPWLKLVPRCRTVLTQSIKLSGQRQSSGNGEAP